MPNGHEGQFCCNRCEDEMGPGQVTCYIHHGGAGHGVAARHGEAGGAGGGGG